MHVYNSLDILQNKNKHIILKSRDFYYYLWHNNVETRKTYIIKETNTRNILKEKQTQE